VYIRQKKNIKTTTTTEQRGKKRRKNIEASIIQLDDCRPIHHHARMVWEDNRSCSTQPAERPTSTFHTLTRRQCFVFSKSSKNSFLLFFFSVFFVSFLQLIWWVVSVFGLYARVRWKCVCLKKNEVTKRFFFFFFQNRKEEAEANVSIDYYLSSR
jgi:hypothetical protein